VSAALIAYHTPLIKVSIVAETVVPAGIYTVNPAIDPVTVPETPGAVAVISTTLMLFSKSRGRGGF
jgi:hypothetical protein